MKRDPKVELMRIIACAIVIGVHTCLPSIVNGVPDTSRVFISCLLADGVAIFWLINGFFLFKNESYSRLMRHTARHILLPMLLISAFTFYFGDWIAEGNTLIQGFDHTMEEYIALLNGLLSWSNAVPGMGHLWYLYVYVLLMLFFPVLKSFADYLGADSGREKIFLLISAALLLVNDISSNKFCSFSHHSLNACFPAAIEVLWGYILYKHREYFVKKYFMVIGLLGFVCLNVARLFIQMHNYRLDITNTTVLYWYTLVGVLCAICIALFCLSTGMIKEKKTKINALICFLASHTMNIYLFHILVRNLLYRYGIRNILQEKIFRSEQKFISETIYSAALIFVIFIVSLAVSIAVKMPGDIMQKFIYGKDK